MKPEEKIILGLDPGFGRTGYAVLTGSKDAPRLIDYGLIETAADLKQAKRLALVVQWVEKVINLHHPHIVAVEKVFFASNTKTALQVGEARGALLVTLEKYKLPILEYTPPQVKLAVTGDGKADKKQIQKMLQLIFHLPQPIKSDDAADAVAIALCALSRQVLDTQIVLN